MASGRDILEALRKRLKIPSTDGALATWLGLKLNQLNYIKAQDDVSASRIATVIANAEQAALGRAQSGAVRTIVEFFPIEAALNTRGGVKQELFDVKVDGIDHPYRLGLRTELQAKYGVYLFYDSRGRALYAGKAKQQNLWKEMKDTFNRDRGSVQKLARVQHPVKRMPFRPSEEKRRQILERAVPLAELAHYFSAYETSKEMTDGLEAFLIRAFPNDLLNKRKESISRTPSKPGRKTPKQGPG